MCSSTSDCPGYVQRDGLTSSNEQARGPNAVADFSGA